MSNTQHTASIDPSARGYAERAAAFQAEIARHMPPEMLSRVGAEVEAIVNANPGAQAPRAGDAAPDFTLSDHHGNAVSLASLLREGPVVIAFYRGEWCPFCDLQLKAYQEIVPQIRAAGASLVAISPQTAQRCEIAAAKRNLDFPLLSDPGSGVARTFGLVFTLSDNMLALMKGFGVQLADYNGEASTELPVPGAFVVAPDGRITFAYVNPDYRERLEPAAVLQHLAQLNAAR